MTRPTSGFTIDPSLDPIQYFDALTERLEKLNSITSILTLSFHPNNPELDSHEISNIFWLLESQVKEAQICAQLYWKTVHERPGEDSPRSLSQRARGEWFPGPDSET